MIERALYIGRDPSKRKFASKRFIGEIDYIGGSENPGEQIRSGKYSKIFVQRDVPDSQGLVKQAVMEDVKVDLM